MSYNIHSVVVLQVAGIGIYKQRGIVKFLNKFTIVFNFKIKITNKFNVT